MKILYIIFGILLFQSCSNAPKSIGQTTADINDTNFLKTIIWDSLNNYVDYHILQNGTKTDDTNFHFCLKLIAVYQYFDKSFECIKNDTVLKFSRRELKALILSDSFSDKQGINCLLRINSQIGFKYRPDLFQKVIVRPKDMSDIGIRSLITALKKEPFVQSMRRQEPEPDKLDTLMHTTKTELIEIKLKENYWSLEKIKDICSQLKYHNDIDDAFFVDFFSGLTESEMIYRLITEKNNR